MENKPLVSIITPTYNHGKFIEDTILSVKNQDYPNIEHIVVDGGSTDNTLEILRRYENKYNLRWISEPDEGQSDAINNGFEMAKGEIIAELDSDDVYFDKGVISYVVEQFIKNPDVDIIYGDDALIDANNNIFSVRKFFNWNYNRLLRGWSISQPATFFRKNVILENQLDKDLHLSMDFEFWLRLGKKYEFKYVKRILAGNRIHKERKRISREKEAKEEDRMVMMKYGQRFDFKYYLLYYLGLVYRLTIKRFSGLNDILNMDLDNLAFRGKCKNKWGLVLRQIFPKFLLKILGF